MKITLGNEKITLKDLAANVCGELVGIDRSFCSVCTDSREADENTLFCAIKGERVDGHDFIINAYRLGCRTYLAEYIPESAKELSDISIVLVKSGIVEAINAMAGAYSAQRSYKRIAITGSVGKTTTKEFTAIAFFGKKMHKTDGNFNSTIGMPLSLMSTPSDAEVAVIEMGMSARGEIKLMSDTARPDIAIITNVGSSHIEMLGSRENIRDAKLEIISGLKKDGILIVNGDDPMLADANIGVKVLSVGIDSEKCDFRAVDIVDEPDGTSFSIVTKDRRIDRFFIPVWGNHNVYAAMFAYVAATLLGEDEAVLLDRLALFERPKMRQNIFEINGITIIEDCYNASPESMKAALDVQASLIERRGKGRSIALLGNMLELGRFSRELHVDVGIYAKHSGVEKLVTFGELASYIAQASGIPDAIRIEDTAEHQRAADVLMDILQKDDILLVKASRSVAAEKIIEILKERLK